MSKRLPPLKAKELDARTHRVEFNINSQSDFPIKEEFSLTSFDAKNSPLIHAGMEAVTSSRRRSERALSTASIQENATDKELFKHTELREKVRTMTLY